MVYSKPWFSRADLADEGSSDSPYRSPMPDLVYSLFLLIYSSPRVSFSSVILPSPAPLIVKLLTREREMIFAF